MANIVVVEVSCGEYEKENLLKLLYFTLSNILNYKSNSNSIGDCTFVTDKFYITFDVYILLMSITKSGDPIVLMCLKYVHHKQAMTLSQVEQWKVAEDKEIHSLEKKNVHKPAILPDGQQLL